MSSPCEEIPREIDPGGWVENLRTWLQVERTPAEMLAHLWGKLRGVDSRLGRFAELSRRGGVPPEADAFKSGRSDDLFPIDPSSVATYLLDKGQWIADGVALMVTSLNFLALAPGYQSLPEVIPSRNLTSAQKASVDHMVGSPRRMS